MARKAGDGHTRRGKIYQRSPRWGGLTRSDVVILRLISRCAVIRRFASQRGGDLFGHAVCGTTGWVSLNMGVDSGGARVGMAQNGARQRHRLTGRDRGRAHGMPQRVRCDPLQLRLLDRPRPNRLDPLEISVAALGRKNEDATFLPIANWALPRPPWSSTWTTCFRLPDQPNA